MPHALPAASAIARPACAETVRQWLRLAEAEHEARAEGIAAARAWLSSSGAQ